MGKIGGRTIALQVVIIGSGGLAREFASFFSGPSAEVSVAGFSSTNNEEHGLFSLPGKAFGHEISPEGVGTSDAVIAIANPAVKKAISHKLRLSGFRFPSFRHPSSIISDSAQVGEGVVVSPNCVVSANVKLGSFSYLNFGVGVGHDSIVGSFCQLNPGAQVGGFTRIGNETQVGSGTTILPRLEIGTLVTVGSGSVVFSDVPDNATVLGNPAKRMQMFDQ